MTDIVEFLRARLDEDGTRAMEALPHDSASRYENQPLDWQRYLFGLSPSRRLGEVAIKRRIVNEYEEAVLEASTGDLAAHGRAEALGLVVALLTEWYDSHPDYDESWRQ